MPRADSDGGDYGCARRSLCVRRVSASNASLWRGIGLRGTRRSRRSRRAEEPLLVGTTTGQGYTRREPEAADA